MVKRLGRNVLTNVVAIRARIGGRLPCVSAELRQMLKGEKEIFFAIVTFAGSSGIDDVVIALARGGMTIKGVLEPGQANQKWAATAWLNHPTIELDVPRRHGVFADLRKLHHKLMVIDEQIVVAGSFNYTAPATEYNDENTFVLGPVHAEGEGITVDPTPCRQLARHMKAEIERIIAGSQRYHQVDHGSGHGNRAADSPQHRPNPGQHAARHLRAGPRTPPATASAGPGVGSSSPSRSTSSSTAPARPGQLRVLLRVVPGGAAGVERGSLPAP